MELIGAQPSSARDTDTGQSTSGLCDFASADVRPCFWLAGKLPDPVRVVSTICEQHRLWKQGAEENRTQPIALQHFGWKFAEQMQRRMPPGELTIAKMLALALTLRSLNALVPLLSTGRGPVEWLRLGALSFLLSTLLTSVMFFPLLLFAP